MSEKRRRVLWISRHDPIEAEKQEIRRLLGEDCLLYCYQGRAEIREEEGEKSELMELIKKFKPDVIIPVLPLSVIKLLVDLKEKYGYEVWEATFETVGIKEKEEYDPEKEVAVKLFSGKWKVMRFVGFSRIKSITIEKELIKEPL